MAAGLRGEVPSLAAVKVVGDDGPDSFERWFLAERREDAADAQSRLAARRPDPDDVVLLQYTSGTTGHPQGAMHSSNTLYGNTQQWIRHIGFNELDVVLMASPLAHLTGFMYGFLVPISLGARSVLQDIWNPEVAARLINDEGATFTMGATPFLAD